MSPRKHLSHYSVAVIASFAVAMFVTVLAGAILLNYILMVNYVHHLEAVQAAIQAKQHMIQIRSAVPTCSALKLMDDARIGAVSVTTNPNSYGHKLARAIHELFTRSGCAKILRKYGHNA